MKRSEWITLLGQVLSFLGAIYAATFTPWCRSASNAWRRQRAADLSRSIQRRRAPAGRAAPGRSRFRGLSSGTSTRCSSWG